MRVLPFLGPSPKYNSTTLMGSVPKKNCSHLLSLYSYNWVACHYKNISHVYLYLLKEFCLLGDLNTDHTHSLPQCHQRMIISEPICQVKLHWLKQLFFLETYSINMQSLFPSVTEEWSFQDYFTSRTPLTYRALSKETSMATMQSLFSQVSAISDMLFQAISPV